MAMEAMQSEGCTQSRNVSEMAGGIHNDAMKLRSVLEELRTHVSGPRPGGELAEDRQPGPPPLMDVLEDVRRELSRCHEVADELMRSVGRTT